MRSHATCLLAVALVAVLALNLPAVAQQAGQTPAVIGKPDKKKPKTKTNAPPPNASAAAPAVTPKQPADQAQASLAKLVASTGGTKMEGDYVPCKFTKAELKTLVYPGVAPVLSEADEEILKQQVVAAARAQTDDPLLQGTVLNSFLDKLTRETLHGLTPSQALNRVIQDLSQSKEAGLARVTIDDITQLGVEIKKEIPKSSAAAVDEFTAFLKKEDVIGIVTNDQLRNIALKKVDAWMPKKTEQVSDKEVAELKAAIPASRPVDDASIVDAARNAIQVLMRPPDVGCAMSILDYGETNQAYGHMIANEYIAVQVVVRNLNRDQAFVLHDVEFQVNSNPSGVIPGRFFSGRDKVIVRALSSAQSSFDPRAIAVHAAEGTGAILSAIVPIFRAETITDAAAAFNGAFVPGLDKYWKDQTADQLNLLNDTGFSSQASSQMSVPQTGTVMFVTFIPAKQFNEEWWTQPCVDTIYLGKNGNKRKAFSKPKKANQENQSTSDSAEDDSDPPLTDIDVARVLEVCQWTGNPQRRKRHWYTLGYRREDQHLIQILPDNPVEGTKKKNEKDNGSAQKQGAGDDPAKNESGRAKNAEVPGADLFRNTYPRPYKKWSGNSVKLFAALANTVVAGTHVTDDSQLQPATSALSCPSDKMGNLKYPDPDKGTVSCTLTGKNLDKVAQLRLRNAKDATDTTTAEGTVKVSGDSNNAEVTFQTATLRALPQPAYNVFTVSGKGVEQKTALTIHLPMDPYVSEVAPSKVDFSSSNAAQNLTITGSHLANVDSVTLIDIGNTAHTVTIQLSLDALRTDTQLIVPLDPAKTDLTVFGSVLVTLKITLSANKQTFDSKQQFQFTAPAKTPTGSGNAPKKKAPVPAKPPAGI
jgi:hypothetical protein